MNNLVTIESESKKNARVIRQAIFKKKDFTKKNYVFFLISRKKKQLGSFLREIENYSIQWREYNFFIQTHGYLSLEEIYK